ncbi:MAG: hypothetical protein HZB55_07540 [Deltaproteobacteria bacterium]|nr:hypothetical protein [Deltaproteobacteria bacterium]
MDRENTVNVSFNFQLGPGFDLLEVHAALAPVAGRHGFRQTGAGTWLETGTRDVGGSMPAANLEAMDAELRGELGAKYLGYEGPSPGAGAPGDA